MLINVLVQLFHSSVYGLFSLSQNALIGTLVVYIQIRVSLNITQFEM